MTGKFVAPALAALLLAQASTNLGIPQTPGARVPESNPATSIVPQSAPPAGAPSSGPAALAPAPSGNIGPAYSFGAAPAPVVDTGR